MEEGGSINTGGTGGEVLVLDDHRVDGERDLGMNEQLFDASVAEMKALRDRKVLDGDVSKGIVTGLGIAILVSLVFGSESVDFWVRGLGLAEITPAIEEFHRRAMEMAKSGASWEMDRFYSIGVNAPVGVAVGGVVGGVVKAVKSALEKRRFSKTPAVVE